MSGNRQEVHPHLCWNCGKRGAPGVGSRMTCLECDVTWMPWSAAPRGDPNHVFWMGRLIACVDFTKPEALGAPALTKQAADTRVPCGRSILAQDWVSPFSAQQLWLSRASRSPFARPQSARARAVRLTAVSKPAYVTAGHPPRRRACPVSSRAAVQ